MIATTNVYSVPCNTIIYKIASYTFCITIRVIVKQNKRRIKENKKKEYFKLTLSAFIFQDCLIYLGSVVGNMALFSLWGGIYDAFGS